MRRSERDGQRDKDEQGVQRTNEMERAMVREKEEERERNAKRERYIFREGEQEKERVKRKRSRKIVN